MPGRFSAARWERAYRRVVRTAFGRVPFYRDQWAAAGRALDEPEATPSAALAGQLHRLCPFALPFDASQEPSLWIGDGRELRDVLALTGAPRRTPVLEVRPAVLDRRTLTPAGPRYGVLLAPDARVVDEDRRHALNAAAHELASRAGRAIVVGERSALDAILPELDGVQVHTVERMTVALAVRDARLGDAPGARPGDVQDARRGDVQDARRGDVQDARRGDVQDARRGDVQDARRGDARGVRAVVVHDPHLGYFAGVHPACGRIHLLWRRFHARPAGRAVAVTALRRRRPVLVGVVPDGAEALDTLITAGCPEHGTPILSTH
ncbi:hypothetical protein [Nonomuraea glycinis]|uniref:hypothetical protein n=1 Tax=Nonomuraea glycinis TaxID=2047744 RepID=UPI002E0E8E0A|nr:hypothetical protein OHA68_26375 [Nonomuraea glycinis]